MSAEALAAAGIPCEWHLSAGVGHGIDEVALRHAGLLPRPAFGLPHPAEGTFAALKGFSNLETRYDDALRSDIFTPDSV
jgi:acetyl esterase/lipase